MLPLFDQPVAPRPRKLSPVAQERQRLSRQNAAVLERLRQGPVTNRELAGISLNHTARISELRRAGHRVEKVSHDHASGLVTYRLGA